MTSREEKGRQLLADWLPQFRVMLPIFLALGQTFTADVTDEAGAPDALEALLAMRSHDANGYRHAKRALAAALVLAHLVITTENAPPPRAN